MMVTSLKERSRSAYGKAAKNETPKKVACLVSQINQYANQVDAFTYGKSNYLSPTEHLFASLEFS